MERMFALEQRFRQYYFAINHYFRCRLDNEMEAKQLTLQTLHSAAATISGDFSLKNDARLLSIATDHLRRYWLKNSRLGVIQGLEGNTDISVDDIQCQAATLYLKLRTLNENPAATVETSAAIHHWIGDSLLRRDIYHQARKVLYHNNVSRAQPFSGRAGYIASTANRFPDGRPIKTSWTDIALLLLVFLLLLPLIYFLATPAM